MTTSATIPNMRHLADGRRASMQSIPKSYACVVLGCTEDCRHPREPQHQRRPVPERRPVSNHLGPMAWVILILVIVFLVTR
jgi:hypothetical protein